MSRIDANIATQIGDVSRPQQVTQERQQQASAAIVKTMTKELDPGQTVTADDARAIATRLRQVVETNSARRLSFDIDKDANNEVYMMVTDRESGEVIRQIPSKEMRDLHARLQEPSTNLKDLVGLLLNKQA